MPVDECVFVCEHACMRVHECLCMSARTLIKMLFACIYIWYKSFQGHIAKIYVTTLNSPFSN